MYEFVGEASPETIKSLRELAESVTWKTVKSDDRHYLTCFVTDEVKDLFDWDNWQAALFLKLPPGGRVHRHIDSDHAWNTYHVVVESNRSAESFSVVDDVIRSQQLMVGDIYHADRQLEHWSVNEGDTDRIHLLCEVYE